MKTTTENGDSVSRAMDWLGQLREDDHDEPAFDGGDEQVSVAGPPVAGPPPVTVSRPYVAVPRPPMTIPRPSAVPPEPPVTAPGPSATTSAALANAADDGSQTGGSPEVPEPAPIGDELRIPTAWCEMGSCISHYAHPAALGEVDNRSRAIAAGWRVDALGRLACPQCLQGPWFWATQPLARWDRGKAVAMATLMTAVARDGDPGGPEGEVESTVIPPVAQALVPLPTYARPYE
jgi:hypothetical protein